MDTAAIARAHGLPPPAPKRELSRAEKGGIAGVAVVAVIVIALVVRAVAGHGPGPAASGSARTAGSDLSVWLGSSTAQDPSAAPDAPGATGAASGSPAAAGTSGFVAEEGRAALEAGDSEALRCAKKLGPKGRVSVEVTFHPDGTTTAQVEIAYGRTPVGICVEEAYRNKARVKPFEGQAITVTRMVHL